MTQQQPIPFNSSSFLGGTSASTANQTGVQTGTTAQQGTGSSTSTTNNIYADPALQGQAGGSISGTLATGQLPGNFGMSQLAYDMMNQNFNQNIAPGLANAYGAGSPQIGAQFSQANEQLTNQLSQNAWGNYMNTIDAAAQLGYTPTGQTTTGNTAQKAQTDTSQAQSQQSTDASVYGQTGTTGGNT